jgi:hypothetical protein
MLLKEQLSQSLEEKEKIIKVQIEEVEVTHELIERQLKEKDQCCEKLEAQNTSLRKELEEEKRIEEVVRSQLKEKEENCEKLKDEIDSLRKELEKTIDHLNRSLKFEKSTKILDNILSHQISPFIKTGLGYDNNQKTLEEDASPKSPEKKIEEKLESYANILKRFQHNEDNNKEGNHDNKRPDFHSRKIRMNSEELLHQEDPSQPGIKIFFLVISFLAKILVIRQ